MEFPQIACYERSFRRLLEVLDGATSKVTYSYDHLGRRISRTVGGSTTWYIYDGWNLIAEYAGATLDKSYTWGMDLSGSMQGAGGVGGLLAVSVHTLDEEEDPVVTPYYPTYDGNGNVTEYLQSDGTAAVHFEYDPFGRLIANTDTSGEFPIRFSTKMQEDLTGLYYYGYRYYNPTTGRWPSRDPIGERGGVSLYGFVLNSPMAWYDYLGREPKPIDVGVDDKFPDDAADTARNRDTQKQFQVHSDEYGNRVSAKNWKDLLDGLAKRMKENGDCCIKTLNITTHGILKHGGIAFRNGTVDGTDDEKYSGARAGEKLGKDLKGMMCDDCQINLRGCSALAGEVFSDGHGPGAGFAHALAKATGCKVLGNTKGLCYIGWKNDGAGDTSRWGNSESENVVQVNPDGNSQSILGTGNGIGPDGFPAGEGRFPDALELRSADTP